VNPHAANETQVSCKEQKIVGYAQVTCKTNDPGGRAI